MSLINSMRIGSALIISGLFVFDAQAQLGLNAGFAATSVAGTNGLFGLKGGFLAILFVLSSFRIINVFVSALNYFILSALF